MPLPSRLSGLSRAYPIVQDCTSSAGQVAGTGVRMMLCGRLSHVIRVRRELDHLNTDPTNLPGNEHRLADKGY